MITYFELILIKILIKSIIRSSLKWSELSYTQELLLHNDYWSEPVHVEDIKW